MTVGGSQEKSKSEPPAVATSVAIKPLFAFDSMYSRMWRIKESMPSRLVLTGSPWRERFGLFLCLSSLLMLSILITDTPLAVKDITVLIFWIVLFAVLGASLLLFKSVLIADRELGEIALHAFGGKSYNVQLNSLKRVVVVKDIDVELFIETKTGVALLITASHIDFSGELNEISDALAGVLQIDRIEINKRPVIAARIQFTPVVIPASSPSLLNPNNCFVEGGERYLAGEFETAITLYTEVLKKSGDYVEAYVWRARAYRKLNKNAEAIADFKCALEINPEHAHAPACRREIAELEVAQPQPKASSAS
ncbi:MAG TPA: tetratricopeptide repeat protein [Planctomycetota bacterium]|nr:tetratricopeptide repeat protein [Planctomycetota bacterium]